MQTESLRIAAAKPMFRRRHTHLFCRAALKAGQFAALLVFCLHPPQLYCLQFPCTHVLGDGGHRSVLMCCLPYISRQTALILYVLTEVFVLIFSLLSLFWVAMPTHSASCCMRDISCTSQIFLYSTNIAAWRFASMALSGGLREHSTCCWHLHTKHTKSRI